MLPLHPLMSEFFIFSMILNELGKIIFLKILLVHFEQFDGVQI